MNQIIIAVRFLLAHKWKISLLFFLTSLFILVLFPLDDLNDFISSKVSQATNNKVFLQFEEMHLNPLTTTLSLDKVLFETEQIENLTIENLSAHPSMMALISRKLGGRITAEGLLGGRFDVKVSPSPSPSASAKASEKSTDKTDPNAGQSPLGKSDIELSVEKISLKEVKKLMSSQLPISGTVDISANMTIDPAFLEQPEGDLQLKIQKFELQNTTVQLPDLGSINLPEIKFSAIDLKGKLQSGKFVIETGKLGSPSYEFYANIKGDIGITIQNMNGQMRPIVNSYNLSFDLQAKTDFVTRASFFLNFIDQYKKAAPGVNQYKFKLLSTAPGMPPQFSPLN